MVNIRENIETLSDVGEVCFVRNPRARRLGIRINSRGEVRVTIPGRLSVRKAEAFVRSRSAWILEKKKLMQDRQEALPVISEGEFLKIRGWDVPLRREKDGESLEDALWRILLREARDYLPDRLEELASQHGFSYNGMKIRKMTSRWGSCTARNSINLNSWLVILPVHLSDYVMLHELSHTVHKNHGPQFWKLLDQHTGGRSLHLRKELARHPIMGLRFNTPRK